MADEIADSNSSEDIESTDSKQGDIVDEIDDLKKDIEKIKKHNALPFWKKSGFRGGASAVFICFGTWIALPFITKEPSLWQWTHENIFRTHTALRSSIAREEDRKSALARTGADGGEYVPSKFYSTLDSMMLRQIEEGQSHILYGSHEFTSLNVSLSPISCYMAQDGRLLELLQIDLESIENTCWEEIRSGVGSEASDELLHRTKAKAFVRSSLTIPFKVRRNDKAEIIFYVYSYPIELKPHRYLTYSVNDEEPVAMPLPPRELNYSTVEIPFASDGSVPQSVSISLNSDGHEFVQQETDDLNPVIKIDAMLVVSKGTEKPKK